MAQKALVFGDCIWLPDRDSAGNYRIMETDNTEGSSCKEKGLLFQTWEHLRLFLTLHKSDILFYFTTNASVTAASILVKWINGYRGTYPSLAGTTLISKGKQAHKFT